MSSQVEVLATGRSLIQRSPTERRVPEYDLETPVMRPWPTGAIDPCNLITTNTTIHGYCYQDIKLECNMIRPRSDHLQAFSLHRNKLQLRVNLCVRWRSQSFNYYIIHAACWYKILKLLKYVTAQCNIESNSSVEDLQFIWLSWRFLLDSVTWNGTLYLSVESTN